MNEQAQNQFIRNIQEARELTEKITNHLDNHLDYHPDEIDWSHSGTAANYKSQLENLLKEMEGKE